MNRTSHFPSTYHTRVFYIACGIFLLLAVLKLSGQQSKPQLVKEVKVKTPIYENDGTGLIDRVIDTTKPAINHRYILRGSDTMFILLQNLILSPGDVTPNNKNAVINWFQQNIKVDSTKNK